MQDKDEYIGSLLLGLFLMQGEIDRLNETLDLARKGELVYINNPQIVELKAELQKYKDMEAKGLEEFKDVGGCWGCGLQLQLNQDLEDIKQLKAENERLKEEVKEIGSAFIKKGDYARELEKQLEFSRTHKSVIDAERIKYKQTLQEIKGYLSTLSGVDNDFVNTETYLRILDLITRVESGEV